MTQDKTDKNETDETEDMPGIPDGMDDDHIVISEDETCVFCGAPLWKDSVEEEEHGFEDRGFCTQYDLGEHEYEQRESVKEDFDFEDVATGKVYSGSNHDGIVVVNDEGAELRINGYGMGGCSYEDIDVVSRDVGLDTPDYIIFELESDPHVWWDYDDDRAQNLLDHLQAYLDVAEDPSTEVWDKLWPDDARYRCEDSTSD